MPLNFLLQGASLGLTAAASPGPFQAFVISESLAGGWRRGAPIAFAPLITDVPIVLLVLLVLGQLPGWALRGLYVAGGLFVLYLAWGAWRQWRSGAGQAAAGAPATAPAGGGLRKGVLMNFLSPGPYTFWALVNGPLLLSALRESPWHGAAFVAGFYGLFIGGTLGLAVVFHQARRLGARLVRALLLASMIILAGFGVWLVVQGVAP
jgi:threonine/homoserine/homoserine lactone efflux protein